MAELEASDIETIREAAAILSEAAIDSDIAGRLGELASRFEHQLEVLETPDGKKLVLAFPLYRTVPVSWFFNYLKMDKRHVSAQVGTEAIYIANAMETLVDLAYQYCPDFDRLVFIEHDMEFPLDVLNRINEYTEEHDIVGSVYFKHDSPHHVMAWMQVAPPQYSPLTAEVVKTMVDNPALYEVDAVAMGFTSIARRVFDEWDEDVPMWDPIKPLIGHDLHFCNEAKKQGFRVWLDSGIGCGHYTLVPIGYTDSQRELAKVQPPRWPVEEGVLPVYAEGKLVDELEEANG